MVLSRIVVERLPDNPHVLKCELARPAQLNAFDEQLWSELESFFSSVRLDPSVRAILLCAQGRHFTAGLDLAASAELVSAEGEEPARRALRIRETGKRWQASFSKIASCGKPVIACVHGACIGAGVEMISACDVRMCTEDATYAMAEIDLALAADVGGLQRFPKIVGNDSLVRELAFSGRRFGADEALRLGFVSRVLPAREALLTSATDLALQMAAKSPLALLGCKTLLNYTRDHSVDEALEYALTWNQALLQTGDMRSAAMGRLAKQVPCFGDLPDLRQRSRL